jgi:hypothetical protein
VPIISAPVIKAPTQRERLINSGPETPGKNYTLPAGEADDLVWEEGPITIAGSASATWRLMRT